MKSMIKSGFVYKRKHHHILITWILFIIICYIQNRNNTVACFINCIINKFDRIQGFNIIKRIIGTLVWERIMEDIWGYHGFFFLELHIFFIQFILNDTFFFVSTLLLHELSNISVSMYSKHSLSIPASVIYRFSMHLQTNIFFLLIYLYLLSKRSINFFIFQVISFSWTKIFIFNLITIQSFKLYLKNVYIVTLLITQTC